MPLVQSYCDDHQTYYWTECSQCRTNAPRWDEKPISIRKSKMGNAADRAYEDAKDNEKSLNPKKQQIKSKLKFLKDDDGNTVILVDGKETRPDQLRLTIKEIMDVVDEWDGSTSHQEDLDLLFRKLVKKCVDLPIGWR